MRRLGALLGTAIFLSATVATGAAGAAGCPNEAFRVGLSALLPACRAYEMVSPVDKAGGSVSTIPTVKTDESGTAVSYYSTTPFAGAQGIIVFGGYVSDRADGAWGTKSVEGPQYNEYGLLEYASPAISEDGTKTLTSSRVALAPGAIEGGSNVYVHDNRSGTDQLVAAQSGSELWESFARPSSEVYGGGDADWSNLLLASSFKLTDDALEYPVEGKNLYEFTGGRLRLADVLPNGEAAPEGGVPLLPLGHSVSADGSKVFFTAAPTPSTAGVFYVRIGGERTVAISRSRRPADKGAVSKVEPIFATADGSQAFFLSTAELLPGDKVEGKTIYRYDADTDALTDVVPNQPAEGAGVEGLVAAGEDGSLLFRSTAGLVPGVEPTVGGTNLYVSRNGKIEFVGAVAEYAPLGEASQNGRWFAFETTSSLRPTEDPPSAVCNQENCSDVYVFDAETEELRCASCGGEGGDQGNSTLGNMSRAANGPSGPRDLHAVADDGSVFFQTPNRLSSRDVNGVEDVYAWRAGAAGLISTGNSPDPSVFANATPDGSSVFFLTSQPLVPQDRDGSVDVYVDREGGGLASQFPVAGNRPCDEESCRGASPAAPTPDPSGSAASGGESSCLVPAAAARRVGAAAHRVSRAAKRAAKSGSGSRAKQLRRRAKAESGKAKSLRKRAGACRRAGR